MRKNKFLSLIACLIVCMTTIGFSMIDVVLAQEVEVHVIVSLKEGSNADLVKAYGGKIKYNFEIISAIATSLPRRYVEALRNDPRVNYVKVDGRVNILEDQLPWGVDRVDAEEVWGGVQGAVDVIRYAGDGIKVGIIDTGIDYNHRDLVSNFDQKLLGYDFVNKDVDPMDDHGHGTHCAGIIAAIDNDIGLIGVAPKVTLYALKALDSKGGGYESDIVAAIEWCINNNVNIISMSLGSSSDMPNLHMACDEAYAHGIFVVAAAGNSGRSRSTVDTVVYPAKYDSVIAVGATDVNNKRARWSSTGPKLEFAAPGANINSTLFGDTYAVKSGTSMACPHVAGVAALVWAAFPSLTNFQLRQRLEVTATDLGTNGRDPEYGYGLINALAATNVAPPTPNNPPEANLGGPYFGVEDQPVTFDASNSYDSDNDPLIYKWDFGDGTITIVNTAIIGHTYTTGEPGIKKTYNVILTVNDGKVFSNPLNTIATITGVNDLPMAKTGGPYRGVTNTTMTFDASKSSDEEGIISYIWDFGDRTKATVGIPTVTHNYSKEGNYTITLVVTDTHDAISTDNTFAEVTDKPTVLTAHLTINMSRVDSQRGSWTTNLVTVIVRVIDDFYRIPIENATVYGHWSGAGKGTVQKITDASGEIGTMFIKVTNVTNAGAFTFTIDKIEKDGKILTLTGDKSQSL